MNKPLNLLVLTALASACGSQSALSSLQKAAYVAAGQATSAAGLSESPSAEGSTSNTAEADVSGGELIQDCTVAGAQQRVQRECDTDGDGQMGPHEQAALDEEMGGAEGSGPPSAEELLARATDGPPPMPPGGGGGEGGGPGGGGHGPRGEGGHGGPGFQCEGPVAVADATPPSRPPRGHRGQGWRQLAFIYDADNSRSLDDTEEAALNADLSSGCEARNTRLLTTYDTDADGVLSEVETQAAVDTFAAARTARFSEAVAAADADTDGQLTCEEQDAMHRARHEAMHAQREEFTAQFDADGDGTLSDSEKTALREALRERIRQGLLPGEEPTQP